MTVIRPNSISGINSITAQSSALNYYDSAGNKLAIDADITGNITGDLTGNITGNVTGNITVGTGATISGTADTIIASTGGSERLRITSSGNVGIGTDTPYTNNSFNSLSIGGSGKYGLIELVKSNGVAGSWIDSYGTAGDGNLRFTTAGTSGAITFWTGGEFTEKVRIDSNGIVTKPYQPVFQAYGISGGTYASGSYMIFPSVHTNIGSHYDTSNGIFTAPVAGTYYFYWSHIGNNTNDVYRFHIHKNNSSVGDWHVRLDTSATGSEYGYGERSINLTLSANDTIRIYFAADGGTTSYPGGNDVNSNYPTFGGYLLG